MLKKLLKKSVYTFATAALLSSSLNAQTALWGSGSGIQPSDSIGRFVPHNASIFSWTSSTTTTVSNGPAVQWQSSLLDASSYTMLVNVLGSSFQSPTKSDGIAFFNSYQYAATTPTGQNAVLTSNTFSLAGHENKRLVVAFQSEFDNYSATIEFAFSTDDGTTWTNFDISDDILGGISYHRGEILINLTNTIAGITDLSQCKMRFIHNGQSYYWAIDDVKIYEQPEFDIHFSGQTNGITLGDIFTFSRVSNSNYIPLNQVSGLDFLIGGRIANRGYNTIPVAANPRVEIKIEHSTDGVNWAVKFSDQILTGEDIPTDSTVIVAQDLTEFTPSWQPSEEGIYRATLSVKHDGADGNTNGDDIEQYFSVQAPNSIYSKVELSTTGAPYSATALTYAIPETSSNKVTRAGWGSMFYFPNGAATSIKSVKVNLFGQNPTSGFTSGDVTASIYEFNTNSNAASNDWSGEPFTDGTLRLVGTGTLNVPYSNTIQTVDINVINTDEEKLILSNDKVYFVSIEQSNTTTGLAITGSNTTFSSFFIGADSGYELGMNMTMLDAKPSIIFSTERALNNTESTTWYNTGMGSEYLPSLLLVLGDSTIAVTETANINNLSVFPNPAQEVLNVSVDLEQASDVQYIMTDISGRIVRMTRQANVMNETITFNIEDLAAGVYTLTVKSDKGISTQKFVKN